MSNFHPLEVVARGGETQLQVGGNLDKITGKRLNRCAKKANTVQAAISPVVKWHFFTRACFGVWTMFYD